MQRWAEHAQVCVDSSSVVPGSTPARHQSNSIHDFANFQLQAIASAMYHPDVDVTVVFEECGTANAYYFYEEYKVVMCIELLEALEPGAVRFVLAHELAHAVIMQLDLPFTGSHEAAADELAAYVLIKMGLAGDLVDAGQWFSDMSEDSEVPSWDDHPTHPQRYYTLTCLGIEGAGKRGFACRGDWPRVKRNWDRILGL